LVDIVMPMSLSKRNQQINSRRSQLGYMLIYSRIKELIIYLLLKRLQLLFLRKVSIMHWIIEIWYYGLEEDNLNGSAKIVLHILLFIMFCCFQRERMGGIQEFQSVERGKRDIYCDKQVEKVVTALNCMLKDSWGEIGSGDTRKKLKSEYAAYLESKYRRNDGSSI